MILRVVGVHGIGNHRPQQTPDRAREDLAGLWAQAVSRNVAVDLAMAYYAPHLNHLVPQAGADPLAYLTAEEERLLTRWLGQVPGLPDNVAQAAWSIPARVLVDHVARSRMLNPALLRPFVSAFIREVGTYLRHPDSPPRILARDTVADAIRTHQPHVVIAHSLGSVVAYEALHAHPDLRVDLLLTIGSPLRMDGVIFDRLQPAPEHGKGRRPPNVDGWVNIADTGDLVAVPRPFTSRFTPDHNEESVSIHPLSFHGAGHYLASAPTALAITDYLRRHQGR